MIKPIMGNHLYIPLKSKKFINNPEKYFQWDDGGRLGSLRYTPRDGVNDCVTRALAIAEDVDYDAMWRYVHKMCNSKLGRNEYNALLWELHIDEEDIDKIMKTNLSFGSPDSGVHNGFTWFLLSYLGYNIVTEDKYSSVCVKLLEKYPNCIVSTKGHLAAVKDGKLRDMWFSFVKKEVTIWVKNDKWTYKPIKKKRKHYPKPTEFSKTYHPADQDFINCKNVHPGHNSYIKSNKNNSYNHYYTYEWYRY